MISFTETITNIVLSVLIALISSFLWNYIRSPLKSFPGPSVTSFTDVWRFIDVYNRRCDKTHLELHRKHGGAVRMGPNTLSLSDPNLISRVYSTKNPWKKSSMYTVNDVMVNGTRISNLFSTRDESWHWATIRPVKSLYSMTRVQESEHSVDIAINLYLEKLQERFVKPGKPVDMADYMLYFAWDAMSQITFSQTLGILDAGCDDQKFLDTSSKSLDYFAPVCQIPGLDLLLDKNPIQRIGPPTFGWANLFSLQMYQKRLQEPAKAPDAKTDFMDKFIELKKKKPEIVDDNTVITYLLSNVLAGSDSTAITMCSAMYNILKHKPVHQKLKKELDTAKLSLPASWKAVQKLPYLDAVMKEAMRVHPGVGLLLERVVPEGGLTLSDSRFVPEGTVVGMNSWVINRDADIFGSDVDSFVPERWLQQDGETEEMFEARRSKMKGADLTFGAGSRMCLGRYLSQLESYKLIATMFCKYDIELASPNDEWKIINSWFVRQENIPVMLKERV